MTSKNTTTQPATQTNEFTAVLLKPDYAANNYGEDVHVVHVTANTVVSAQINARKQAFNLDNPDGAVEAFGVPDDYIILALFPGHVENLKND